MVLAWLTMILAVLVFLTQCFSLAEAAVPPEVPQLRNYSVFSPYEFQAPAGDFYGLNVVTAGGPSCQGYIKRFDFRQTGAPSTSKPAFANLDNYLEMLRKTSGIFFSPSHGGSLGGFYVEAYSTLAAAEQAAAAYISADKGSSDEIQATLVGGGYFGVRVSAGWVQRMLREANQEGLGPRHDIVVQVGCNSYNANVAFVNSGHLSRNFAGLTGLCPIDTNPTYYHQISSAIFNTMAGIKADPFGVYRNAPFITGVGVAQGLLGSANPTPNFRSAKDTLMPLADLMRLYSAPRIALSDVDQDSDFNGSYDRELYRYNPYPTYPYGSGTMPYPGPVAVSGQISNSSGPLRINLVFSEPMDVSSFTARLRFADGSTQAVSGSWGSYELSNDSWTATTSISGSAPGGPIRLEVFGRKVVCGSGQDTTVMYLDLDGDGTGVPGTYDTSGEFSIITTQQAEGSWSNATAPGVGLGSLANSTNALSGYCPDNTGAGICSATWSGPNYSRAWSFDAASGARVGIATGLAQGTYTLTCVNCAQSSSAKSLFYSTSSIPNFAMFGVTPTGNQFNESRSVSTDEIGDVATTRLRIKVACVPGGYCSGPTTGTACAMMKLYVEGGQAVDCFSHLGGEIYGETLLMPQSASFAVKNETQTASDFNVTIEASIYKFAAYDRAVSTTLAVGQMTSGGVLLATVSVQEVLPTFSSSNTAASIESTQRTASVQSWDCGSTAALAARQGLSPAAGCTRILGSELVFLRPATMTVTVQGSTAPPVLDSASVKIYGWTGSSWTLSGIPSQGKTISTSSVILATGSFTRSGQYGILFSIADASAPLTSWSIQGSSSGFAGITFVSTYSYLVLWATDPVVDGFHSGLATTYYRIDGLPGDAYSVYSTSLSFLPGTHWVDSYATDYAGNVSSVTRATITVTAGSVTKLSGDLQVDGNLLVGFLGSGAKAEVVARAEYDYALMLSSVDGRAMLAVDNANFASIGTAPASGRLTLAGVAGDTALALRSGNSTAAVTGAQLAFGYDGTGELRHRLYTQHGSAANLNKLVFALWTPASGSSTTLGGLPLLSLEGSTITPANALVQVMPGGVSDVADKELVVSSGGVMGGGDVLRWDRWVPSAAYLKKDVRRLGRAEEEKAWADIAALKPVEYRRKAWGPDAPLERGYVFEETPQSIRDGPGATSLDERLVNAELALKAAMRRIVELKARIKKVKEARR